MHRSLFFGTILFSSLLGAGCGSAAAPGGTGALPTPQYVTQEPEGPMTRVTGYAWDPEAYFLSLFACGGPTCPLPPILLDNSPLVLRSMVVNARVTLVDAQTEQQAVAPAPSDPTGTWVLPKVPSREAPEYRVLAQGQGTLAQVPGPFPPVPAGTYVPTVSQRPVVTDNSLCAAIEANHLSNVGILDAVAKYLSSQGTATTVADLVNPRRFSGVVVFWLYVPGFNYWRLPSMGTGVEASTGRAITVDWAPPGALPPSVQSPRGFVVSENAPVSNAGVTVFVYPANAPPGEVTYSVEDSVSDDTQFRPFHHPPVKFKPVPGVISFVGLQLIFKGETPPKITAPSNCLP